MPSGVALLTCVLLVGCSSPLRGVHLATGQTRYCVYVPSSGFAQSETGGTSAVLTAPTANWPKAPQPPSAPPLQELPGGGTGDGVPRGRLRPVPQGGSTTAGAGSSAAVAEPLVTGGAVVAAAGSVLLLCFTVKAVVDGRQTPIDIADTFYGTHFGDLSGWVKGRYHPRGAVHPSAVGMEIVVHQAADGTLSVETTGEPTTHARSRAESAREDGKKRGRLYATYRKVNETTHLYYSGRTSMVVDLGLPLRLQAELAIRFRDMNHHVDENQDPPGASFDDARLDVFALGAAIDYEQRYDDPAYWRIRGREQQLIDFSGGAHSDTGKPHRTENIVRAVAKDNPRGRRFHDTATIEWGELHRYTGY